MSLPDDSIHETIYRQLRNAGAEGWGGVDFSTRMAGWDTAIRELQGGGIFPAAPARLLELGSGAGDVSLRFAKIGYRVEGIEISSTAVEWAEEKNKRQGLKAKFYQGNACDLDRFGNGRFDIAIDGNCFHCVIGEDRENFLSEVYRVLSPGGVFFVSTMTGDPKALQPGIEFDAQRRLQLKKGCPYRYLGHHGDILRELMAFGFQVLSSKVVSNAWWDHLTCLVRKPG
jgi:SAM-dependent methyltransferase